MPCLTAHSLWCRDDPAPPSLSGRRVPSGQWGVQLTRLKPLRRAHIACRRGVFTIPSSSVQYCITEHTPVVHALRAHWLGIAAIFVRSSGKKSGGAARMIEVRNVRKVYPNGHEALRDISFTIPAGQMVAIIGRSGAG